MTPYLQLLLNRKRNDPTIPYDDPSDPIPETETLGPTISLRGVPRASQVVAPRATSPFGVSDQPYQSPALAQESTIPVTPATQTPAVAPLITKPRDVIQEDRDALKAAQAKHHSKLRDIGEGLAQVVGSGVGLNVHRLIYPHGTEEEKAQRQLNTDLGIQNQKTEEANKQSTITLRNRQAEKIKADIQDKIDHPDTSDADKAKFELAKEILKSHPQGFDPNDPADVIAKKKLEDAGIPIPGSYGKQPTQREPLIKERKNADGSTTTLKSSDFGKTWEEVPELGSAAPPQAAEPPDTSGPIGEQEKRFRDNAKAAQTAAEKAEADVKNYIVSQKGNDPNYDPGKDANVASMTAEARRQREFMQDQTKRADDLAVKKIEAAGKTTTQRAKVKTPSKGLSRGVFRQNNPQATQGKSDTQIDAMIRSGGLVPVP